MNETFDPKKSKLEAAHTLIAPLPEALALSAETETRGITDAEYSRLCTIIDQTLDSEYLPATHADRMGILLDTHQSLTLEHYLDYVTKHNLTEKGELPFLYLIAAKDAALAAQIDHGSEDNQISHIDRAEKYLLHARGAALSHLVATHPHHQTELGNIQLTADQKLRVSPLYREFMHDVSEIENNLSNINHRTRRIAEHTMRLAEADKYLKTETEGVLNDPSALRYY